MARTLPLENTHWPLTRVVVRKAWVDSTTSSPETSSGGWTPLAMTKAPVDKQKGGNGFFVNEWERVALPQVGRARFTFQYGLIDGSIIGVDPVAAARQRAGNGWDPTVDGTKVPDLVGFEIRIQAAPYVADVSTAAWRTVFWGECLYQEDQGWPAAAVPAGQRIYHCVDGLYRTSRWRLDRHGYAVTAASGNQSPVFASRGHPGYNTQRDREAPLLGNRWNVPFLTDGGTTVYGHTFPGQGDGSAAYLWTDQQVIEHALAITRPQREPRFLFKAGTGGLPLFNQTTSASAWPVAEGDSGFDILTRVCRRERGRGLVFLDWDDDTGSATAALHIYLRAENQNAFDVKWTDPTNGSAITVAASTYVTTGLGAVDLVGDHRAVEDHFAVGGKDQFRLDGLESQGEQIEVLATLAYQDGIAGTAPNQDGTNIERAWQATEQTAFRAQTAALKRVDERWRPVYQYHRLPLLWQGQAGDGDNGQSVGISRCDYRCGNDGTIVAPDVKVTTPAAGEDVDYLTQHTSPLVVELLGTLPLFDGYTYSGATPAMSGGGAVLETADRRPPMALIRIGKNAFVHVAEKGKSAMMEVRHNLIALYESGDMTNGTRVFSDPTLPNLGAFFKYTDLAFTVGIRLPHRARLHAGLLPSDPQCKRHATIIHPGLHLWLAHPSAIWDLDATTGSSTVGHAPKRQACAGTSTEHPGILRDDRGRLAQLHAMAWSWYGQARQTLRFALRDCGFLPSYGAFSGNKLPTDGSSATAYTYPQLGMIIPTAVANGETHVINTPVTRIHYDNERGVTKWETDWSGLDFVK